MPLSLVDAHVRMNGILTRIGAKPLPSRFDAVMLRSSWRHVAKHLHPDRGSDGAEFKAANDAHEVLAAELRGRSHVDVDVHRVRNADRAQRYEWGWRRPYGRPEPEPEPVSLEGVEIEVLSVVVDGVTLQATRAGFTIAGRGEVGIEVFLSHPHAGSTDHVDAVLLVPALDPSEPAVYQRRPITGRSYDSSNRVVSFWFPPC
jgi:hypothetical protein